MACMPYFKGIVTLAARRRKPLATGDNAALVAWYGANPDRLAYDPEKKNSDRRDRGRISRGA